MKYLDGQQVMVGDIIEVSGRAKSEAVVVEIIEPNSFQAIELNSPGGGVMIDDPATGLTLWPYMDEDVSLIQRVNLSTFDS